MASCTCNLNFGEVETGRSLSLLVSLIGLLGEIQARERLCIHKTKQIYKEMLTQSIVEIYFIIIPIRKSRSYDSKELLKLTLVGRGKNSFHWWSDIDYIHHTWVYDSCMYSSIWQTKNRLHDFLWASFTFNKVWFLCFYFQFCLILFWIRERKNMNLFG